MKLFGYEFPRKQPVSLPVEVIPTQDTKSFEQLALELKSQFDYKKFQDFVRSWNVASYSTWDSRREVDSYVEIDDVYSIISLLAETAARIPFYGYTIKNEEAMKAYLKEARGTLQKKHFFVKSMEDLPENDPVSMLLQNPNGSAYEYNCLYYTLLYINGEVFEWKERIKYGARKGVTKLHLLNAADMIVFVSTSFPQRVTGYRYITPYGETIDFEPDEIIHTKYANPRNLYNQQFRGMSPLTPFRKRMARMEGSMDVSVSQMQNGGVPGIVYDEIGAGTSAAKEIGDARKIAFASYLNNTANKGAPYFSSGKMGYLPLGLKLVDLDLVKLSKEDFDKLCNGFHISNVLLNSNEASTESNVELQTKRMYTNSTLPNVMRRQDSLITGLLPEFPDKRRYIEYDISGVKELQGDLKLEAEALNIMWWVSPNEKRKIQRFDDSDNPIMDEMIIDSGKMLLNDLLLPPEPPTNELPTNEPVD